MQRESTSLKTVEFDKGIYKLFAGFQYLKAAELLEEAVKENNVTIRKALYFEIQEYVVEDLMPWVFLYVPMSQNVLANTITNWSHNPMGQKDFFSISFHGEHASIDDPQLDPHGCGYAAPWDYYCYTTPAPWELCNNDTETTSCTLHAKENVL